MRKILLPSPFTIKFSFVNEQNVSFCAASVSRQRKAQHSSEIRIFPVLSYFNYLYVFMFVLPKYDSLLSHFDLKRTNKQLKLLTGTVILGDG